MANKKSHTVTKFSERPARPDGTCFYCHATIGEQHNKGCVCRDRSIVVRFSVDVVMVEPEDFDADRINFMYNDGTWCADNLIQILQGLQVSIGGCLCGYTKAEYLREATPLDEEGQGFQFNEPDEVENV